MRGPRRDPDAAARDDRRFAAVFAVAVALWCGAVGLALGFVDGGWDPLASALLHATVAGAVAWCTRWIVLSSYGFQLDAGVAPARNEPGS